MRKLGKLRVQKCGPSKLLLIFDRVDLGISLSNTDHKIALGHSFQKIYHLMIQAFSLKMMTNISLLKKKTFGLFNIFHEEVAVTF